MAPNTCKSVLAVLVADSSNVPCVPDIANVVSKVDTLSTAGIKSPPRVVVSILAQLKATIDRKIKAQVYNPGKFLSTESI